MNDTKLQAVTSLRSLESNQEDMVVIWVRSETFLKGTLKRVHPKSAGVLQEKAIRSDVYVLVPLSTGRLDHISGASLI